MLYTPWLKAPKIDIEGTRCYSICWGRLLDRIWVALVWLNIISTCTPTAPLTDVGTLTSDNFTVTPSPPHEWRRMGVCMSDLNDDRPSNNTTHSLYSPVPCKLLLCRARSEISCCISCECTVWDVMAARLLNSVFNNVRVGHSYSITIIYVPSLSFSGETRSVRVKLHQLC